MIDGETVPTSGSRARFSDACSSATRFPAVRGRCTAIAVFFLLACSATFWVEEVRGDIPKSAPAESPPACNCEEKNGESRSPWSGSVALGFSLAGGEDDVITASADFDMLYDAQPHRLEVLLTGFYSLKNSETYANRQYGEAEYRNYFVEKWYAFGSTSAERNLWQDLRFRSTVTVGSGYQILEREHPDGGIVKKDSASLQLGGGYQYQRISASGDRDISNRAILEATGVFRMTLLRDISWMNRASVVLPPGRTSDWHVLATSVLNIPVFEKLGLRARVTLDYLNGPILESRGGAQFTYFTSLGVSYSF